MYQHIFFDLDRTLWDFETNSHETLIELIDKYKLVEKGISSPTTFIKEYYAINDVLWEEYRQGKIDKELLRFERFKRALDKYEIVDRKLVEDFGNDYVYLSPLKTNLLPHTEEILDYLRSKYILHIITNGFEEVQHIKLKNSGIDHYFSEIITSERAGYKKPDKRIFDFSVSLADTQVEKSIMIGDSLDADILGAKNAGMHQIFFNPNEEDHSEEITHEISSLKELRDLL
ncbi:MAG: YjjG family noncanonical pyrimidine nucleotidase [Bacteroidetes bacterium]|nr:YjjG family noncanonical pyrimidine nucleotidase [Bacteroidota bacterium]